MQVFYCQRKNEIVEANQQYVVTEPIAQLFFLGFTVGGPDSRIGRIVTNHSHFHVVRQQPQGLSASASWSQLVDLSCLPLDITAIRLACIII